MGKHFGVDVALSLPYQVSTLAQLLGVTSVILSPSKVLWLNSTCISLQ